MHMCRFDISRISSDTAAVQSLFHHAETTYIPPIPGIYFELELCLVLLIAAVINAIHYK